MILEFKPCVDWCTEERDREKADNNSVDCHNPKHIKWLNNKTLSICSPPYALDKSKDASNARPKNKRSDRH